MIEMAINPETLQAERSELKTLLGSETFRRAPMLAHILEYLCERQFQGETFIKEYEIATRVMGRPNDFDPQVDGSVRVNLHHLRKKLKQYYETEGVQHSIRIALPVGQSLPSFIVQEIETLSEAGHEGFVGVNAEEALPPALEPVAGNVVAASWYERGPAWLRTALAIGFVLVAVAVGWMFFRRHTAATDRPLISDAILRIACGRSAPLYDDAGRLWVADTDFNGGKAFRRPVSLTMDGGATELYNSGREGNFSYDIPLSRAAYEVHLYFAEASVHGEGFRTMAILFNGKRVAAGFDVTSDAGGFATPTEKVYAAVEPAADGKLHISFKGVVGNAFLNGIEILPGNKTRMRTLRQTTLSNYYVDPAGTLWSPDAWYRGGRVSHLQGVVPELPLEGFYQNERFGNFTYSIPVVAEHTYSVTLYFQDVWWSQPKNGTHRRRFNVACNGKELLSSFDILSNVDPGTERATMHFAGLKPSGQGKLLLSFSPTDNYASVNAMMVEDEGPGTDTAILAAPPVTATTLPPQK